MSVMAESPRIAASHHASASQRICELCGAQDYQVIATLDRDGEPLETAICKGCGLVAHRQIPTDAELSSFYASQYRCDYHHEMAPSPRRVMRAWKNGQRIVQQIGPYLTKNSSVLEVGAGIGATVKNFELAGFQASGVDLGAQFLKYGREVLQSRLETASLFDLPAESRYDNILLVHVIEHFASPVRALQTIHTLLRPDGKLYVECPNLAAPFATRSRLFHYAHVVNFTPWTLLAMARKCGFELERSFVPEDDCNIEMLFRRVENGSLTIEPNECQRTLSRMFRYNNLTYHLRWAYIQPRARKVFGYLQERFFAKQFVRRLANQCQGRP